VRTALILGLLVAIAGAVTYAIVFGPEHGLSLPSSRVGDRPEKAAPQDKATPSSVVAACQSIGSPDPAEDAGQEPPLAGVTGACDRLGADSASCKACLSMNRKDCGGRTKSGALPVYDWGTIPERELPRAVAEVGKAVAAVKARTDARLEKDKAAVQKIYDTGSCSDIQSYLRDRIKELEQPDLQATKDTVERTAVCLREKHRVLSKLMLDDLNPVLYERIRVLGDAAIEMAILARDLSTTTAKASQKLTELRKHNARCGT
jgi:hypothetical protein